MIGWFRAATLLLMLVALSLALAGLAATGCAMKLPDLPPPVPSRIVFTDQAPDDLELCVTPTRVMDQALNCLTLGELRGWVRARRYASR